MSKLKLVLLCFLLTNCGGKSVGQPAVLSNVENYSNEAMQAYANENWMRAQKLFNYVLKLNQSIDNRKGVLTNHINLVEVALAIHDEELAQQHLIKAEKIVEIEGLTNYQARITLLNALLAMKQKKNIKASQFLQAILPSFDEALITVKQNDIQLAAIICQTKIAFETKKNEALWVLRYRDALKKEENKNDKLEAQLLRFQAKLSLQQGKEDESVAHLKQALLLYKGRYSRSGIAATLLELGMFYQQQKNWVIALDFFKRSMNVFKSLGNTEKVNEITTRLAKIEAGITHHL